MKGVKKYLESFYYTTWLYGKIRSYVQPWISTSFNTNEVVENLYIGDIASAYNKGQLKKLGITHVVTAVLGVSEIFPNDFINKNIPLRDVPDEDIDTYFLKSNEFISKAIDGGGKVFVHCICGVSRSATLVAAYLMYKHNLTCEEAIEHLQKQRNCVDPNKGFRKQLENFEGTLKNLRDAFVSEDISEAIKKSNCYNVKTGKWIKRRSSI